MEDSFIFIRNMLKKDLEFSIGETKSISNNLNYIPDNIFDIHTHVFLKDNLWEDLRDTLYYNEFSFKNLEEADSKLFKWKKVRNICFGQPQQSMEGIRRNNEYISNNTEDRLMLYNIGGNEKNQIDDLCNNWWKWVKIYWFNNLGVTQNISYHMLEALNNKWLPILIHLPNSIIEDINDLKTLLEKFKNIKFIIAHWWNIQKCRMNLEWYKKSIIELRKYPNIWFDTSCINQSEYMKLLLTNFDIDRIYYWSDFPISLIKWIVLPGKNWDTRIVSEKPIRWINYRISQCIVRNLWLNLEWIINIQQFNIKLLYENLKDSQKDKIFFDNARYLF